MAHRVAMYFEIHRDKRAVMHLIRPDSKRRETVAQEENYLKIFKGKESKRFRGGDKRSLKEKIRDRNNSNDRQFFDKYGDEMKELVIMNKEQFNRDQPNRLSLQSPDL